MAREHILVADDEPDVLDLARDILVLDGYQVTTARDGLQAVELARGGDFALFLTDVMMPRMDGLEAFREIRKFDSTLVGVAMTGYGTMQVAVQALKEGFADFLMKPFGPSDLSDAVNRSLENERLRRENFRLKALIPLFELSRVFMTETHLPALLEQVVQTARQETEAAAATLLLLQPDGAFEVGAHAGWDHAYDSTWHELATWLLKSKQPLVLDRQAALPLPSRRTPPKQGSLLALPLFSKERPIGALLLSKAEEDTPFVEGDAELLNVLAGQVSVAIENARLFEEREAAYRELEQMDHMKSEFINIAAHELRTPLSLVMGYAGLLEEESEGTIKEYAQSITHNAMRLRTIVDDMTNLRHLEAKQAPLDLLPVDLRQIVTRVIELVDPPITHQGVKARAEMPEKMDVIWLDSRKIELVLSNLLSNAYKFSPPTGRVWVRVEDFGSEVQVSVQDQGPGIPKEEQGNIWKRFYQVEHSLTRVHGGIGLGLAIVKGTVELHGGTVWVESTVGEGSTFYFTLPRRTPT